MILYSSQSLFNLLYCAQSLSSEGKCPMDILEAIMPLTEMCNYNRKPWHVGLQLHAQLISSFFIK